MSTPDLQLLRQYVLEHSEDAFTELVHRHVPVVHACALRLLDDEHDSAGDISQQVFSALARQARTLLDHPSILGWLHTATLRRVQNHRRQQFRRQSREDSSDLMNPTPPHGEPDWSRIRGVIDQALGELPDADREVVLLRFFGDQPFAEIGSRLGVQENTARMRATRALDRLRDILARHGIHSTATALGATLLREANRTLPSGLGATIARQALSSAPSASVVSLAEPIRALVVLATIVGGLGLVWKFTHGPASSVQEGLATGARMESATGAGPGAGSVRRAQALTFFQSSRSPASTPLELQVVDRASGVPIPHARVDLNHRPWGAQALHFDHGITDANGRLAVSQRGSVALLELISRVDGYADTRVQWRPDLGEPIPASQVLALPAPCVLSGIVVDPEGRPIPGVQLSFSSRPPPTAEPHIVEHHFLSNQSTTDQDGRWRMDRIAEAILPHTSLSLLHPDYVSPPAAPGGLPSSDLAAMREGTHVTRLRPGTPVHGFVRDDAGRGLSTAVVHFGNPGEFHARNTTTRADGSFTVLDCESPFRYLTAEAPGFAPRTISHEPTQTHYEISLSPGRTIRLHIAAPDGTPVKGAHVWLDNGLRTIPGQTSAPAMVHLHLRSDSLGSTVWSNAPRATVRFDIKADGYLRRDSVEVPAHQDDIQVTLQPGVCVRASVRDAHTDEAVSRFEVQVGCPFPTGLAQSPSQVWFGEDSQDILQAAHGRFEHTFCDPVVMGLEQEGILLKFKAPGYQPAVSPLIHYAEGEVSFDVALEPGQDAVQSTPGPLAPPSTGADNLTGQRVTGSPPGE